MDANGLRCLADRGCAGFAGRGDVALARMASSETRTLRLDRQQRSAGAGRGRDLRQADGARSLRRCADPGGSFAWWDGATAACRLAALRRDRRASRCRPIRRRASRSRPTSRSVRTTSCTVRAQRRRGDAGSTRALAAGTRRLAGFARMRLAPAAAAACGRSIAWAGGWRASSGYPLRTGGITEDTGEAFPSGRAEPHDRRGCVPVVMRCCRPR